MPRPRKRSDYYLTCHECGGWTTKAYFLDCSEWGMIAFCDKCGPDAIKKLSQYRPVTQDDGNSYAEFLDDMKRDKERDRQLERLRKLEEKKAQLDVKIYQVKHPGQ